MRSKSNTSYPKAVMKQLRRRLRVVTRRLGFDIVRAYPPTRARTTQAISKATSDEMGTGRLWISFSLYGRNPLYVKGILSACESYRAIFPGWRPVIFIGESVPQKVVALLKNDYEAVVIQMVGVPEDSSAMFWRYLALDSIPDGAVLFRDADSRASSRERAAVDEWLVSGKTFHIMRDHVNHTLPMMGGMWGARAGVSCNVGQLINDYSPDNEFSGDQRWLASVMYPIAATSCIAHQDEMLYADAPAVVVRPFPAPALSGAFVGQGVLLNGSPRDGHKVS